ncbi:unnamed protein product [Malus baccata var. baccata]
MNLYLEPQGSNRIIHTLLQQKPKAIWVFFKTSSSSIATEICPSSSSAQIYIGERCLTMSRTCLLVCLLLLIVFTSQFEWKQYGDDDPSPSTSKKHKYISEREETAKEKIILSQEKSIQKLNELVRSLREQLLQCRGENEIVNGISAPLTELLSELERHPLLED